MISVMLQARLGKLLFLVLALSLSACRQDNPPKIEICILNGVGGGDCAEADGTKKYRLPSEMKNYWATNEPDQSNFASWCYNTSLSNVLPAMAAIKRNARGLRTKTHRI